MNTTNKTFDLRVPADARSLGSGQTGRVGSRSTMVFYVKGAN
jgi:hypothetical protein